VGEWLRITKCFGNIGVAVVVIFSAINLKSVECRVAVHSVPTTLPMAVHAARCSAEMLLVLGVMMMPCGWQLQWLVCICWSGQRWDCL
jgi:hypothetical protein